MKASDALLIWLLLSRRRAQAKPGTKHVYVFCQLAACRLTACRLNLIVRDIINRTDCLRRSSPSISCLKARFFRADCIMQMTDKYTQNVKIGR